MTAEFQLPHPLFKYVPMHCTQLNIYWFCNLESCGHMCSYLDRGLKNEDRQQTNKTRHTNYVMRGGKELLEKGSETPWNTVERNIFSPVATACAELLSLGTPCMPTELNAQYKNCKMDYLWHYAIETDPTFKRSLYKQAKSLFESEFRQLCLRVHRIHFEHF